MRPKISFCIPTYNRKQVVVETIKNIVKIVIEETTIDEVEINVSDNGSIDGTYDELCRLKNESDVNINLHRFEKNKGIDSNILAVVGMATGQYCWLFGDDDILLPGSLRRMLKEINSGCDIYLVNRKEGITGQKIDEYNDRKWLRASINEDTLYHFLDDSDIRLYFSECASFGGVFSFISSDIFCVDSWNKIKNKDKYIGTCYEHTGVLCELLKEKHCTVKYIVDSLVAANIGTPFQGFEGYVRRTELDLDAWISLSDIFSYDLGIKNDFCQIIIKEHPIIYLSELYTASSSDIDRFYEKMLMAGYSELQIRNMRAIANNRYFRMYCIIRKMKRKILQTLGR